MANGGAQTTPLPAVPASEHVVRITNGNPGLDHLLVSVNGRTMDVALKSGETRTVNLVIPGMSLSSNTVGFTGQGAPDARATVLLADGGSTRKAAGPRR